MRRQWMTLAWSVVALIVVTVITSDPATAQRRGRNTFAAVPGVKGGQEMFGPYEVDPNWPQNVSTLPGHEAWTWGAGQSVFAESPDRVFVLFRGELPNIPRPDSFVIYDEDGPGVSFPTAQVPWRNASVGARSSLPGALDGVDDDRGVHGLDHRWEHCLVVVNREGKIIEEWTQWDHLFRRPHFVAIDPWDPEKHVWVVDDYRHAIFKFTNDGKELVQTIGVPNERGNDMAHFYRPTFLAFTPDAVFVADGYANTRVVKLDKQGNFVKTWGQPGERGGNETRPGYMNNVHGVAVDLDRGRVFVNDRQNNRLQVFDMDGNFQDQWSFGPEPTDIHLIYMGEDNVLWAADRATSKILGYNQNGELIYSWGIFGDFPGAFFGVHAMSVDQEGNFYVAEVGGGRVQKFIPREGARPETMVGKPRYVAWQ
jgi:sugar lactone lactonase YvrE